MNCPIIEVTADGVPCGRCWYYLPDGATCPRHGDVRQAVARYEWHGELTLETELPPRSRKETQL